METQPRCNTSVLRGESLPWMARGQNATVGAGAGNDNPFWLSLRTSTSAAACAAQCPSSLSTIRSRLP